jgi:hypothetical protein
MREWIVKAALVWAGVAALTWLAVEGTRYEIVAAPRYVPTGERDFAEPISDAWVLWRLDRRTGEVCSFLSGTSDSGFKVEVASCAPTNAGVEKSVAEAMREIEAAEADGLRESQ